MLPRYMFFASLITVSASSFAQSVRPLPWDQRLLTADEVGNVEGIQRFGTELRTDPDQGVGHTYHVYPTKTIVDGPASNADKRRFPTRSVSNTTTVPGFAMPPSAGPYQVPFNATAGLRQYDEAPFGPPMTNSGDSSVYRALSLDASKRKDGEDPDIQIYHQPLVQIRVRVVEVVRDDNLDVASIIDYVSKLGSPDNTLIVGNNVNGNSDRTSSATRFLGGDANSSRINIPNAASSLAGLRGSGALVNLTSDHLNFLAEFLATEVSADVVTAPEVVTLNGQSVEFISGQKQPFFVGQTVFANGTTAIQQVFYKHVGAYISVTPTIVNWGKHGEGEGEAPIVATDVGDWRQLIEWMNGSRFESRLQQQNPDLMNKLKKNYGPRPIAIDDDRGQVQALVPISWKTDILDLLNEFSKQDLIAYGIPIMNVQSCDQGCGWDPNECVIDLAVALRLTAGIPNPSSRDSSLTVGEDEVRAVANVVQVKSGHGVVMAGLIGERELEGVTKVPVLGDIPIVGAAFRSKSTNRQKTETIVFIEARVMDRDPVISRAQSSQDFQLGQDYVSGEFLDNPLEYGMYRAGFGDYLPPRSPHEKIYWERLGRKVRKAATALDDTFE